MPRSASTKKARPIVSAPSACKGTFALAWRSQHDEESWGQWLRTFRDLSFMQHASPLSFLTSFLSTLNHNNNNHSNNDHTNHNHINNDYD